HLLRALFDLLGVLLRLVGNFVLSHTAKDQLLVPGVEHIHHDSPYPVLIYCGCRSTWSTEPTPAVTRPSTAIKRIERLLGLASSVYHYQRISGRSVGWRQSALYESIRDSVPDPLF